VGLAQNANNALKIVELAGRTEVPVHAGCARPMTRDLVTAEHVHGESGLDGPDLPEPKIALRDQHGVDFIIDTLRAEPERTVTLCALGPLTNLAMALIKAPDIAARIEEIVLMGGAYFEVGNITPAAEFNIYVDPEAARTVFACGAPITMMPLDVTHQMLGTPERVAAFSAIGNRSGAAVAAMLGFSERFDLEKYRWRGAPLHDPCVTVYLLAPEIFEGRPCNVEIETASALTRGMTVADYWHVTDRPHNATFIRSGDSDAFYALLTERIARLP
jgi:purine nucleosidase